MITVLFKSVKKAVIAAEIHQVVMDLRGGLYFTFCLEFIRYSCRFHVYVIQISVVVSKIDIGWCFDISTPSISLVESTICNWTPFSLSIFKSDSSFLSINLWAIIELNIIDNSLSKSSYDWIIDNVKFSCITSDKLCSPRFNVFSANFDVSWQ